MTFTVLARDRVHGLIGAATASKSLAVGNAVIALRPGVGAVASQAWTNAALRGQMLDAMAAGDSASEAVARVHEWDASPEFRQVAALDWTSVPAAATGDATTAWAGHAAVGDVVVVGNLLASATVLGAMSAEMARPWPADGGEDDAAAFARRLVRALVAADAAGGDVRGRQSAAVLVARQADAGPISIDLRVDDHADPMTELDRLVSLRATDLMERVSARTE
ncbi:putative Ntn-hydrolase superfamily protein [Microbacterium endophyticum]|uniref:Putative Ntn-hydrolase superfamily protein n=1 Tax=Microbacterium endophyticum TaxID=1526412 RepID=A0A7W4V3N5_9MICO|nr:DUF1028 domain-containing protein [Microbacterium endophyticum]MBB2975558.1 putative Ntn-hydrolase superfamily protein [Microbacterium endophyticum]NIK35423.1 putative Ntn-hydrolase superfamily protein [Microbacterium endophyticum]